MNTNNSFSSISMSRKRERFEKGKRLNAHAYKKLFQIAGRKMKEITQGSDNITTSNPSKEVDQTIVMKSCSDSKHEKHRPPHNAELSKFQFEVSTELQNHLLPYVNKLRDYWHKGQNSVFFDKQDRIIKVVFFILSLLENVKQPILIITTSSSLSLWENEFSNWSKSTNVVTYKEKKDLQDENGSIKFQVILSSPDIIIEDFDHIKWEMLVIDECQRSIISKHFEKIKKLMVNMKLLTITSETMSYQNILSLLDSKYEDADVDTNISKETLSPFIAFECKFNSSEIEEYWVPVHLSSTQIEQYCLLLNSNFEALSSYLRNSSSLHDILTNTQKCCDHPYLVDPTLRDSLITDVGDDQLDAEISVSGKLQLLDKFLLEIKQRRLRVLVLFQSVVSSEKITIGDILDDLVERRFGEDSYIRIQPKILSKSQRKEALEMFNNIESEMLICLLDYRSCHRTITLSSIDVAILFNSDWNPSNDLKALQKITIETNCERLRVLRLYSSFTIEEKALILSKQGTNFDTNTNRITWNTCHQLLAWGASYLFSNHSNDHDPDPKSKSKSKADSDTCFIDDLVRDLSSLLLNKNRNAECLKSSIISNAQIHEGVYSKDILLFGEKEAHMKESSSIEEYLMENEPNVFWSNLFKESNRIHTRNNSRVSRRVHKSFRNPFYWFGDFDSGSENDRENIEKNATTSTSPSVKTKSRRRRRVCIDVEQSTSYNAECTTNQSQQTQQPQASVVPPVSDQTSVTTPLETELENIKKEREEVTKLHEEKKLMLRSECEKEITDICKKYDALIEESETYVTKKMKVLEEYYDFVYANKVLADTLTRNCDEEEKTEKSMKVVESGGVRVVEIPASALVQSEKRCTSTSSIPLLRAPAPHLRSSSLFASFNRLPNMSHHGTC